MLGAVGFESEENKLRKLRERLHLMSDEELIQFGKECRELVRFQASISVPRPLVRAIGRGDGGVETETSEGLGQQLICVFKLSPEGFYTQPDQRIGGGICKQDPTKPNRIRTKERNRAS
jgi:hypothetical protein